MFNIKFDNENQVNVVLMALSKQPYEVSASVIETVLKQAKEQAQSAQKPQENAGLTD